MTKALLVYPEFRSASFWNYRETCELVDARYPAAPLGLCTVAALLPPDWDVSLVDRNVEPWDDSMLDAVDVVARFGGEEFLVVLPETGEEGAVALAERIRARVEETPPVTGGEYGWLRVTVSIGVATVPSPRVNSPEELIAVADEALYRAKAQGRNRVCS